MTASRAGVVVSGAGIAGVACAAELHRAGIPVEVRERGRVPGGRMASRRFDGRPADTGAAYLTVSDPDFAAVVDRWRATGLAREWTDTFVAYGADGRREMPGPMRWAGSGPWSNTWPANCPWWSTGWCSASSRARWSTGVPAPRWRWPCPGRRPRCCSTRR